MITGENEDVSIQYPDVRISVLLPSFFLLDYMDKGS